VAAIGLGVAALVIWLVLRPIHTPIYNIRDVNVSKFAYSPSSHALDAAASYTVVAYNGNAKIGIKYDSISIDTSYLGQVFDHAVIPGFYHGHRQNKTLPVSFTTTGFPLTATNGALLETNIQAQSVPLLMRVDVTARLKIGAITTASFKVHVNCDVVIKPPAATTPAQVLQQSCRRV
jgi:subtilase family serine protease